MAALRYSIKTKTIPVELECDGAIKACELREMSGKDRDEYVQASHDRMDFNADGSPKTVKNVVGLQADLISRCLWEGGKRIPFDQIQTYPATMLGELYEECRKLNNLGKKPVDLAKESKNDLTVAGVSGS